MAPITVGKPDAHPSSEIRRCPDIAADGSKQSGGFPAGGLDAALISGLFLLSLECVQVGGAQLNQIWALILLAFLLARRGIHVMGREVLVYLLFLGVAIWMTLFAGYQHTKETQQIIKFSIVYPAFYLIGRQFGRHYIVNQLPYGYATLFGFFIFEIILQKINIPYVYKPVEFMGEAIHGSFLERNWFALFFFGASYLLFLQSERRAFDAVALLAFGVTNALVSESKTVLIPCGIVLMTQLKGHGGMKVLLLAAAGGLYFWRFGTELSGDMLNVRLEEERGLAFAISMRLAAQDWLGHGFGFVESFFAHAVVSVKGLGAGTNAVFAAPIDMMLIAGIPGMLAWLVFFCGLGLGRATMICLAPLAAWSLSNPLHQNEMTYLLLGYLVSWGRRARLGNVHVTASRPHQVVHFDSTVHRRGDLI
ncbi:hypothetical protein AWB68_07049 [Caballeronia choica]|uniref:Uncharacterized protein n=1 Tax=Caballeronia choica TaxID=326476 RepID=A0A158KSV6_9BURK|nr:hypothetical protein [Caballeronia choica]SAL83803.1 hypothetical protein AWB68_07049 [Caballeronia choica]